MMEERAAEASELDEMLAESDARVSMVGDLMPTLLRGEIDKLVQRQQSEPEPEQESAEGADGRVLE